MPRVLVTRTHLALRGSHELRAARPPAAEPRLEQLVRPSAATYRELYRLVGDRWHWRDRNAWSDGELAAYLARPEVEVWVARRAEELVGYFELRRHADCAEIMYFGLMANYIGQGLGGWLLTRAAQRAFDGGAPCVVLNTCTLDAPAALPNYLARGFRIIREEDYEAEIP